GRGWRWPTGASGIPAPGAVSGAVAGGVRVFWANIAVGNAVRAAPAISANAWARVPHGGQLGGLRLMSAPYRECPTPAPIWNVDARADRLDCRSSRAFAQYFDARSIGRRNAHFTTQVRGDFAPPGGGVPELGSPWGNNRAAIHDDTRPLWRSAGALRRAR